MNISVKELNEKRTSLENEYEKIEKDITNSIKKEKKEITEELISKQDSIDEQIDLIDRIINNLNETPKLYEKLLELTNEK